MAVRDNRAGMDRHLKEMEYLAKHAVRVGALEGPGKGGTVQGGAPKEGSRGLTVADVFSFHEFGLGNNPERSSLNWVMENKQDELLAHSLRLQGLVLDGKMTGEQALSFMGEKILSLVKQRIRDGIPPPLSEARKKQKVRAGKPGNTPLIDTSQLINSTRYNITGSTT